LFLLSELRETRRIPDVPIYLDSPMAISATEIFSRHTDDHKLTRDQCERMCSVARYSHTPDESRAIDRDGQPKVIVSASGMATGGRVLHHLRRFLPDERSTVLLVGYQAAGTRGRALLERTDELKIHGQYVAVRARIRQIEGLSAHADYSEILSWLEQSKCAPRHAYVTHGEPNAADAMRTATTRQLRLDSQRARAGRVFRDHLEVAQQVVAAQQGQLDP
jgi:metallo-beta-lactamase family protein